MILKPKEIFKSSFPLLTVVAISTLLIFRKFFFQGLLPVPYNIMVGWYFPFNLGGWTNYDPAIPFKGGLYAADVFRQIIPWKKLVLEQINTGQFPLWNPHNFSGEPLLANIQTAIFYPLTLLFFVFNFDTAWSLYIVSSPIIALLGMFFFMRTLSLSKRAAIIASLSFAFSGHMLSWLEWGVVTHSGVWLPCILACLYQIIIKKKNYSIFLVLSSSFTIFAGYPQESAYTLLISLVFALLLLFKDRPGIKKNLWTLIKAGIVILLITSIQTLPTFQFFKTSALNGSTSQNLFFRTRTAPRRLLTAFSPDYFGNRITNNYWADTFSSVDYMDANLFVGSVALVFALYAVSSKSKTSHEKFFIVFFIATLLLALNTPFSYLLGKLKIPMLSTGVASGILFLSSFCLSALSGFGVDKFGLQKNQNKLFQILLIYLFVWLTILLVPTEYKRTATRNLFLATSVAMSTLTALFFSIKLGQKTKLIHNVLFALIILAAIFEHAIYANKMLSFSSPVRAYPSHLLLTKLKDLAGLNRISGFWDTDITNNLHSAYDLYSSEGYNPLHSNSYQELFSSAQTGKLPETLIRSDADLPYDTIEGRNRLLDLTSTKYITASVTNNDNDWEQESLKYDPERFELIWQSAPFKIYENASALPRISLYNQYEIIADKNQRLERIFDPNWDPHSTVILEEKPRPNVFRATGSAEFAVYEPNRIIIDTKIYDGNALLLLTDSFYSTWQVFIDDLPGRIYKANHTFRGVVVPQGEHTIEFKIKWL